MRKPVMAANWKMHKTPRETGEFFASFKPLVADSDHCEIVVCPPFTGLVAAVEAAAGSAIGIGAQNLYWEKRGAFTGEIAPGMLSAAGCRYAIIGHSERRQFFGETDETVSRKIAAAQEAELVPIVCVGELLDEREAGQTEVVLKKQVNGAFRSLTAGQFSPIIIAYEPVWAIGTGKTATPEMAVEAHRFLRGLVGELFGPESAQQVRILYGGSVKPANVRGLMAQPDIDGALVGGASLEPDSFAAIVNF